MGSWLFCVEVRTAGAGVASGDDAMTAQAVLTPRGEVQPPQRWMWPLAESSGVVWWWCVPYHATVKVSALSDHATRIVAACQGRPAEKMALWTLADVPAEEVERLRVELSGSLPPGFFSHGFHYLDADGNKYTDHPDL